MPVSSDGDRVIVRQQPTAENGDMVVALTEENEATVKRFYKEDGYTTSSRKMTIWTPLLFMGRLRFLEKSLQ